MGKRALGNGTDEPAVEGPVVGAWHPGAAIEAGGHGRARGRVWTRAVLTAAVALATSASLGWSQPRPASRTNPDRQQRYQIAVMERVLEGAVEHGAALTRDRLKTLMPADMLLTASSQARGFRLDGYGMFFDVAVPSLEGTLPWTFRALDQNDLGLDNALRTIRSFVEASQGDSAVEQALKRLEVQVAPLAVRSAAVGASSGGRPLETTPPSPERGAEVAPDPILENPQEAYRTEIRDMLMDAMLEHSRSLGIGPTEWLTVAARRSDDRPRLAPVETDASTVIIRASGADLTAFLSGQISKDEARKRMDVRVF